MEITAIEPRRKSFSQLYIDGESAVKIDAETMIRSGFRVGSQISDEQLFELIQASDARRASEKALYLLESRNHSKKELEDKIARTAASREVAKAAAQHMEDIGLVDDESFARDFAHQMYTYKKFGDARVRQELMRKGIDRDLISQIIEEHDNSEKYDNIRAVLEKRYGSYNSDEKVKRRAIAALQRLGYRYDEIKTVITEEENYDYEF